jgi:outer membrane biosynthesis protein TonB
MKQTEYEVKKPIPHGGKTQAVGNTVLLNDKQAVNWLSDSHIVKKKPVKIVVKPVKKTDEKKVNNESE